MKNIPKCSVHKQYKAKRPPITDCPECRVQYHMVRHEAARLEHKIVGKIQQHFVGGFNFDWKDARETGVEALLIKYRRLYE